MRPRARTIMLQGTASSVGKSLLATALCRILRQDGLAVAPFKAQNMSNNSFVTAGGLELGRAQAVQAEAAGVEPVAEMNPVLLKPEADHRSQVVILGKPDGVIGGADFISRKREFWPVVTRSLDRLRDNYDVVVIEGAGSPAEINLRQGDIANMNVARYAGSPVLLVGDIDRGGVFAHLVGTLQLLQPEERALVAGTIINKFRGTISLLQPGVEWLTEYSGLPVAGVIPWIPDVGIADEDAVALENRRSPGERAAFDVAVVQLPHIANFDDADALAAEPEVNLRFVSNAAGIRGADLVILPGTKSTMADLEWMRQRGIDTAVLGYAASGGAVIGICGGFQMLGDRLLDPDGVESTCLEARGLGLLRADTTFMRGKMTDRVTAMAIGGQGMMAGLSGIELAGYEVHMGRTVTPAPAFALRTRSGVACGEVDGAVNTGGSVVGTYLHGLFDNDSFRASLLATLALEKGYSRSIAVTPWSREQAYDRLAEHVRAALDMNFVHRLLER